jgi:murein DD-endopeptidase MepM/ murein hydrolase activator NlpD
MPKRRAALASLCLLLCGAAGAATDAPPVIKRLRGGLANPMPGGQLAGYSGDTGLGIAGSPRPVYALGDGTLDYAERGHTLWTGPRDSPFCVRLALDAPIPWRGRRITHIYYAHLSAVVAEQAEGAPERRRVAAGEQLGVSGSARGVAHLHLGLLLDGNVEQDSWHFLLREAEVRKVLGGYRHGEYLAR